MWWLWEKLHMEFRTEKTQASPHRGETLHVRRVWKLLWAAVNPEIASANPHWREAISVWPVWEKLSPELKPSPASQTPPWGLKAGLCSFCSEGRYLCFPFSLLACKSQRLSVWLTRKGRGPWMMVHILLVRSPRSSCMVTGWRSGRSEHWVKEN